MELWCSGCAKKQFFRKPLGNPQEREEELALLKAAQKAAERAFPWISLGCGGEFEL